MTTPRAEPTAVGVEPALTTRGSIPAARRETRRLAQRADLVIGGITARVGAGIAVAAMGEDADHPETEVRGGTRHLPGPGRCHPAPPPARVDLDHDPDAVASRTQRIGHRPGADRRVDADAQPAPAGQIAQAGRLRSQRHQRVGDEQVVQPGIGEDLGLADRADGQPGRPGGQLATAHLDALVGLGMRPQVDPPFGHRAGHPRDRGLHALEVDDHGRRVDHGERRRREPRGHERRRGHGWQGPPRSGCRSWEDTPSVAPDELCRRVGGARGQEGAGMTMSQPRSLALESIAEVDPDLWAAMQGERRRQHDNIELIASENYVSAAVMEAQGSWLTNKYAEGLPGKRYYGGCEFVDVAEVLAQERALALYPGAEHVNVQPHSGAQANMAAYFSVLEPGDRILGMNLAHGGHLTHGMKLNFSGKLYDVQAYGVRQDTERIDYDAMEAQAREVRPKLIVGGASAYPRLWDFERMADIAHSVGALLFVDMAHVAGLVAAGVHPSPFPHADIVTTTTHKTLRGPRGGMIFSRHELPDGIDPADFPALKGSLGAAIDKTVFPGVQGGPLMQVIAGKAVAFKLAAEEPFREDQRRTVRNAAVLAETLADEGARVVSGGTDNHLMLVDVTPLGVTGKEAEHLLDEIGITVNKNGIPFDPLPPNTASGIRLGTPATTSRGFGEDEMRSVGRIIIEAIRSREDGAVQRRLAGEVAEIVARFPVPGLSPE